MHSLASFGVTVASVATSVSPTVAAVDSTFAFAAVEVFAAIMAFAALPVLAFAAVASAALPTTSLFATFAATFAPVPVALAATVILVFAVFATASTIAPTVAAGVAFFALRRPVLRTGLLFQFTLPFLLELLKLVRVEHVLHICIEVFNG